MLEKKCSKCGKTKPFLDFYKHPLMGDGRLNKCKSCIKDERRDKDAIRQKEELINS